MTLRIARRRFVGTWICALLPRLVRGVNSEEDELLLGKVCRIVREREAYNDPVSRFREAGSERIDAVAAQYIQVAASFDGNPPARILALRWTLCRYLATEESGG